MTSRRLLLWHLVQHPSLLWLLLALMPREMSAVTFSSSPFKFTCHCGSVSFVIHDNRLQLLFVQPFENIVVAIEFRQPEQLPTQLVIVFRCRTRIELEPVWYLFVKVRIGWHQHLWGCVKFSVTWGWRHRS